MSTATLRLQYRAISQKITLPRPIKIPWKLGYFLAAVFSLLMVVFYIFSVNALTQGAYTIKNYHKEIKSLMVENKALQANFAEAGFLGSAQVQAKALSFEKTGKVKYIHMLQNSLAEVPKNYQK